MAEGIFRTTLVGYTLRGVLRFEFATYGSSTSDSLRLTHGKRRQHMKSTSNFVKIIVVIHECDQALFCAIVLFKDV